MALRVLQSWSLPLILLGLLLWYWTLAAYPRASFWYQVNDIVVFDTPVGEEVVMDVERTIRRPFTARWSVLVRELSDENGWEIVCTAQGSGNYRPDAVLPNPTTLGWWTDGQCATLEPGYYMISTVWRIDVPTIGDRIAAHDTDVFRVFDP